MEGVNVVVGVDGGVTVVDVDNDEEIDSATVSLHELLAVCDNVSGRVVDDDSAILPLSVQLTVRLEVPVDDAVPWLAVALPDVDCDGEAEAVPTDLLSVFEEDTLLVLEGVSGGVMVNVVVGVSGGEIGRAHV